MAKKKNSKTAINPNPVMIDWKNHTYTKQEPPKPVELDPEGYHPFVVEHCQLTDAEDAVWYMERMLELTGIGLENIPDWKDGLGIIVSASPVMAKRHGGTKLGDNSVIPHGTLYLRIDNNHWGTGSHISDPMHLADEDAVTAAMMADPEAKACAHRLVHELGAFRAWLDIKDRLLNKSAASKPSLIPQMNKFASRPTSVWDYWYHVQLAPMDAIKKPK